MYASQSSNGSAAVYRLDQRSNRVSGTATAPSALAAPLLFVTGASRSGTTMLARMLGAHSQIMAFNELHFFGSMSDPTDLERQLGERDLSELAATLLARQTHGLWGGRPTGVERAWGRRLAQTLRTDERTPLGLFAATVHQLAADSGRQYACEQTPRNIFYAKQLLDLYPNARFLHIVRDPRAVLASQKNRWKLRRLGAEHLPLSEMLRNRVNYHPLTMAKLWARATEEAVHLEDHPRFLILRFEDLAAGPVASAARICHFLGLKFEQDMLEIPRWGSSNIEHSTEAKGISSEVVDRWRKSLSRSETFICEKSCHLLMQRFGYATDVLYEPRKPSLAPSMLSYPFHIAGVLALNPGRAVVQLRAMVRSRRKQVGSRQVAEGSSS